MPPPRSAQSAMREDDAPDGASGRPRAELLSEVAHVFKTPLGVITGYVELLQLRDDPALRAEALSRMEAAAERLEHAIDRLLSSIRQEDGALLERLLDGAVDRRRPSSPMRSRRPVRNPDEGVKRLLVVDDDDEIRQLLLRTLPTDGFELLEARDGLEALALLEQGPIDLIVLDWNMPNATGEDVLAELAQRGGRVPVIVLTAHGDPWRRRIAETRGVDAFLAKPFSPLELLREIERLLTPSPRERLGS